MDHSSYASFAIWNKDIKSLDFGDFILNRDYIILGLNRSKLGSKPWDNFHSSSKDDRLRKALEGTSAYGCLLTDLFTIIEVDSNKLNLTDKDRAEAKARLLDELDEFMITNPTFICLGGKVYDELMKMNLGFKAVKVFHPAAYVTNEAFDNKIKEVL